MAKKDTETTETQEATETVTAVKTTLKHRELTAEELKALKTTAPTGYRELAPGKKLAIGPHLFTAAKFSMQKNRAGEEELVREGKKCFVKESLIAGIALKDGTFLS